MGTAKTLAISNEDNIKPILEVDKLNWVCNEVRIEDMYPPKIIPVKRHCKLKRMTNTLMLWNFRDLQVKKQTKQQKERSSFFN